MKSLNLASTVINCRTVTRHTLISNITKINCQHLATSLSCGVCTMREDDGTKGTSDEDRQGLFSIVRTKSNLTFVSRTNPVTGKMDWIAQHENYDYIQEIARSGYGDMLHDRDRNEKYYRAIQKAVKLLKDQGKQVRTLDIGTGTGLLSMMAAEAGADVLTACEAFPPMAHCAKIVLEANGFKNKIKLIPERSTDVLLADLGERANLLVTELFDTELIGEGAIGSYTDAHDRLMEKDCVAVPTTGIMYVQAVHCKLLRNWNSFQPIHLPNGCIIHSPVSFTTCSGAPSLHDIQIDELQDHLQLISPPVEVFRFDFSNRKVLKKEEQSLQTVVALQDGSVDAFVMWWDLLMDPEGEILLSCAPCWNRDQGEPVPWRDHWMQALYYPSLPLTVKKGESFKIFSSHDEYSLWFDTRKTHRQRPVCECGLHVAFSRNRLGQINEQARKHVFISVLEKRITSNTVCLVVSDGSDLPLLAAALGAKKVFYLDSNWSCRKIIKELIKHNGQESKITVLEKNVEDIEDVDLENMKINLVIAEPYFQAAHLPWEHLYFWYAAHSLQKHLTSDVVILPEGMQIKAMAVQFRDLHKIRTPVGNCEGFDITEFDKLIEVSSESADEEIEPQSLWEYPALALSVPATLATIDFSQPPEEINNEQRWTELQCCQEGILNGVAFWTDYDFGLSHTISTGLANSSLDGSKIKWDMFSKQGVKLFRHGRKTNPGFKVHVATQFTPATGDFAFKVEEPDE